MLRKISFWLLLAVFIVCFKLWFEHFLAWQNSLQEAELNCRVTGICFSAGGPHTYGFLAERYLFILGLLLFFLFGKSIHSRVASITICLSSVILITHQFWQIYQWYSHIINMFSDYNTKPFFNLLRNSVPFIWLCLSIVIALAAIQIETYLKPYFNSSQNINDMSEKSNLL